MCIPRETAWILKIGRQTPTGFSGWSREWHFPCSCSVFLPFSYSTYFHSTTTLNYIRAILASGFASLNHPRDWSLSHVRSATLRKEFEEIVTSLSDALDFSRTIGIETGSESTVGYERGRGLGSLGAVDLYTRSAYPAPLCLLIC